MGHTWHARAHMVEHGIQQSRRTTQHIQLREMLWDYALSSNQSEFPSRKQMKKHCGQQAEPLQPLTSYQSTQRSHITHLALEFPIQQSSMETLCGRAAYHQPNGLLVEIGRKLEDWELRNFLRGDLDNPCSFSASFSLYGLEKRYNLCFQTSPSWNGSSWRCKLELKLYSSTFLL